MKHGNGLNTVILTGGNGNVGSVLAESLSSSGYRIVLLINNDSNRIQPLLASYPDSIRLLKCDLTSLSSVTETLGEFFTASEWNPTALVHTAAVRSIDHSSLLNSDPKEWIRVINTNVIGTYHILKVVLKIFSEKNIGGFCKRRIVLFGSNVSRIGLPFGSAYAASKAAVANLTRSLSTELGQEGVLINTISPGPIEIDDSHFEQPYRAFRNRYYEQMLPQIPLARLATPDDVVSLALFLISQENNYITGEEFFVTGGKL